MKVVRRSNYDKEGPQGNQWFVAQRLGRRQAEDVARVLNGSGSGPDYYEAVEDNYVLPPVWV